MIKKSISPLRLTDGCRGSVGGGWVECGDRDLDLAWRAGGIYHELHPGLDGDGGRGGSGTRMDKRGSDANKSCVACDAIE